MKRIMIFSLAAAGIFGASFVADTACSNWDFTVGTVTTMTSYDDNGKIQSSSTSTVKKVDAGATKTTVEMESVTNNPKGKEESRGTVIMTCEDGKIMIDISGMIPAENRKETKGTEYKFEGNMVDYPATMSAGQSLPDVVMIMRAITDGTEGMTMTYKVVDRKVVARESRTTPAGTYDCFKITSTNSMAMQIGPMNVPAMKPMQSIEWFSFKVGAVRMETHKNDKMMNYSELTAFKKG
ncbi:MAG TPA: hypothetical protein VI731_07685 [Bacteroidia bacterium]|nr:hypothetical protein [Bacteroidia bacterium]